LALFLPVNACSAEQSGALYDQYSLLCDIISEQYSSYRNSDQSDAAKMTLMQDIEKQVNNKITSDQVKRSYSMLIQIAGDDPYKLLQEDVKSRTGKTYTCNAFKALTKLYSTPQ
jgi:hypothetical protein